MGSSEAPWYFGCFCIRQGAGRSRPDSGGLADLKLGKARAGSRFAMPSHVVGALHAATLWCFFSTAPAASPDAQDSCGFFSFVKRLPGGLIITRESRKYSRAPNMWVASRHRACADQPTVAHSGVYASLPRYLVPGFQSGETCRKFQPQGPLQPQELCEPEQRWCGGAGPELQARAAISLSIFSRMGLSHRAGRGA